MTGSAIALLEFDSVAAGIEAGDAMVKRAALSVVHAGTVQPGKYLVLIAGTVAEVAYAVGFQDADYFSKLFKQTFGVSPSAYGAHPGPMGQIS